MRSRLTRLPIECWENSGRLSRAQRINCFSQRPHASQCRFNASCSTEPDSRDAAAGIMHLVVLAGKKTDQQDRVPRQRAQVLPANILTFWPPVPVHDSCRVRLSRPSRRAQVRGRPWSRRRRIGKVRVSSTPAQKLDAATLSPTKSFVLAAVLNLLFFLHFNSPSKVIAIGHPIKLDRGCRVELPRTASPFDIAIERIDQRRRAVKNQIPIPPQLNLAVLPSVKVGDVPGVGYSRAEVHYLRIRVHITPEFVTAIDQRDGR